MFRKRAFLCGKILQIVKSHAIICASLKKFGGEKMKNLTNSTNLLSEKTLSLMEKENNRSLVSEKLLMTASECFNVDPTEKKVIRNLKIAAFPFLAVMGIASYSIDKVIQTRKVASLLNCSNDQVVFSEGDFTDKQGSAKETILGCATNFTYKANIKKDWLQSLRLILKDAHLEALDEETLASLEAIGGNVYLSDRNIEAYEQGSFLPNLQYVGGKVFVNAKEYHKKRK